MSTKQWNAIKRNMKKHAIVIHKIMEPILARVQK